jgi:hypothetical protein
MKVETRDGSIPSLCPYVEAYAEETQTSKKNQTPYGIQIQTTI